MFLTVPFSFDPNLQNIVLILNTVLLIVALVVIELVYADKPAIERRKLRIFFPFALVLITIFIIAVITQVSKS